MGLQLLTERWSEGIAGALSRYGRMLIQGAWPGLCYAEGMAGSLYAPHLRIFDYPQWAQPLRDTRRENAERRAEGQTVRLARPRKIGRWLPMRAQKPLGRPRKKRLANSTWV
jgi:hypothetical protein